MKNPFKHLKCKECIRNFPISSESNTVAIMAWSRIPVQRTAHEATMDSLIYPFASQYLLHFIKKHVIGVLIPILRYKIIVNKMIIKLEESSFC